MKSTVAVVTLNRPECVRRLMVSLLAQTRRPDEIIIVNNGECDRTATIVHELSDSFSRSNVTLYHLEREDTNLPAGRNAALSEASGEIICYLDDDTIAAESWLDGIYRGYRLEEEVVGVGGPSIAIDENCSLTVEIRGDSVNLNRLNRYGEAQDMSRKWIPPEPVRTDLFQGSNMSFRTDRLREIGGFDPGYQGYPLFEDTDVMAKFWKRNETLMYHPDALVYHERVAHGEKNVHYNYWYARNSVRFRRQNYPERFRRSLLRLLLWKQYHPSPVWKQIVSTVFYRNETSRAMLRGYADALRWDG